MLKAVEGCLTSCGAVLISVGQSRSWYEGEIGLDALTVETLQTEAMAREEAAAALANKAASGLALPDSDFCLECWLKSLEQRSAVMGL